MGNRRRRCRGADHLPPGMAQHTHFSEDGFDRANPKQYFEAQLQRVREAKVAVEEMRQLQEQLFQCYYRYAPDHYTKCKDLATDYYQRLRWEEGIPPAGFEDAHTRLRREEGGGISFERTHN